MIYDNPWYANISPETGELGQENCNIVNNRHHGARKDLKEWMEKVNLPYHSPHKFRHGFAVFSLKHADNMGQLKAISQNLMHANISITDGIYGGLSDSDINEQITSLTKEKLPEDTDSLKELLKLTLNRIDEIEKKLR
jgi:integrase